MGPGAPRPDREAPALREVLLRELKGYPSDFVRVARGLPRRAEGYDPEHPPERRGCGGHVVDIHVDPSVVRPGEALDPLRREEVLDVRDEPVPEVAPDVRAFQGELPEPDQENHRCVESSALDKGSRESLSERPESAPPWHSPRSFSRSSSCSRSPSSMRIWDSGAGCCLCRSSSPPGSRITPWRFLFPFA